MGPIPRWPSFLRRADVGKAEAGALDAVQCKSYGLYWIVQVSVCSRVSLGATVSCVWLDSSRFAVSALLSIYGLRFLSPSLFSFLSYSFLVIKGFYPFFGV